MNLIHRQGLLFSLIALLIVLASRLMGPANSMFSLSVIAALIFFLGVPHGALDPVFAHKLMAIKRWQSWLQFVLGYLLVVALSILGWWQFPLFFMSLFLLLSMLHFSKDLTSATPAISRLLYGGAIIVLPTALHVATMQQLFSLILGASNGLRIVHCLQLLVWPWMMATGLAIILEMRHQRLSALEILAMLLLASLAEPLISFTVYFCCMHSLRHILRAHEYSGVSVGKLSLIALGPMAGVALMAVIGWVFLPPSADSARLLQILFILLAALTLPHMLLIHRVKYPQ